MEPNLRTRDILIGAAAIVLLLAVALFTMDRVQHSRLEKLRNDLTREFTAELAVAVQKLTPPPAPQKDAASKASREEMALPVVAALQVHSQHVPQGTGRIEIFNLTSQPAFADASGTRVTGELYNGTGHSFSLISFAIVALDKKGKVLRRQAILCTSVGAGDRRSFEALLDLPLSLFAAHRFELDAAK